MHWATTSARTIWPPISTPSIEPTRAAAMETLCSRCRVYLSSRSPYDMQIGSGEGNRTATLSRCIGQRRAPALSGRLSRRHRSSLPAPQRWKPFVLVAAFIYRRAAPMICKSDLVKGTGLRPYLDALGNDERPHYLAAYLDAIDRAYPRRSDGNPLFSLPRLFIVAQPL